MRQERDRHNHSNEPTIRIITLGTFLVLCKENSEWRPVLDVVLAARGPSLALVKVLVSSGPSMDSHKRAAQSVRQEWEKHEASRDTVIDALWPEEEMVPADPDNAVSVAKSVLNRALRSYTKEDVVQLTDGTDKVGYALNTRVVEIDADAFELCIHLASEAEGRGEKEAALQQWEKAHALIQGDFLPHDIYNDWSTWRRKRLQGKYRMTLHRISWHYAERGRIVEAVELLHPHVLTCPTDLDALCILLPLLARQNRYEEALQFLETYKCALQDEGKAFPAKMHEIEDRLHQAQEEHLTQVSLSVISTTPKLLIISSGREYTTTLEKQTIIVEETKSEIILPNSVYLQIAATETTFTNVGAWFGEQLTYILYEIECWKGKAISCGPLQNQLDQKIRILFTMKSQYTAEDYILSRRTALVAIATLPAALLTRMQLGSKSSLDMEEFLPRCAASITANYHLLRGSEFSTAETALMKSFLVLTTVAEQPSRYQKEAARLTAQSCLLLSLIMRHRGKLPADEIYCQQAVYYSRDVAQDALLEVSALKQLADTHYYQEDYFKMQEAYQQAEQHLAHVPHLLRARICMGLADAYAHNGQDQESLRCLGLANEALNHHNDISNSSIAEERIPLYADFDMHSLLLWEGLTRRDLGNSERISALAQKHHQHAWDVLSRVNTLSSTVIVPERTRVEIEIHQAATAILLDNPQQFCDTFTKVMQGIKTIGSRKRHQEALLTYQHARQKWSGNQVIKDLIDLFPLES